MPAQGPRKLKSLGRLVWLEAGLGTPSERNDSACMMLMKDVWREALVLLQVTAPAIGKQGSVERAFIRLLPRTLELFLNKLFSER